MSMVVYDPVRIFQVNGQVCPLKSASAAFAVGTNQTVISALSGSKHKIMGWDAISTTATVGTYLFKSNNSVSLTFAIPAPPSTNGAIDKHIIIESGYLESSSTGDSITVDIATATVGLIVYYITYVPTT